MLKKFLAAAAVASLSVSPALAATSNPAASLSVAKSVRASTPSAKQSELGGGFGFVGLAILAGIVAIGVIAIVNNDNSDSN
ncbi:hypothetical protein KZ810_02580 [Sphingomonas sp. RHCKR47]|jgi:hypothetical protein|uniref:hypothetical protein n=1 Tax=Sphingomonas citricola TaxID=2862498 RepID=UPI001CA49F11|nr:hypothetical protein [Sphingomonas citricola]MBW6522373.1 hypothetical protein [Sphingomonas citricola]